MEKNLAFRGCAQLVGWLSPDLIPHILSPHIHPYIPNQLPHPKISPKYTQTPLQTPSHNNRHLQIPKDTARHLQKFKTPLRQSSNNPQTPLGNSERLSVPQKLKNCLGDFQWLSEVWWGCLGLYLGMFWGVLRCSIVLKGVSGGSVLLGWNQGSAIIPFWNNFKRQDLFHPTHLRPQNIKTSLCKLSKNYWVMLYFVYFRSVRVKLQSTVSLDHPVVLKR